VISLFYYQKNKSRDTVVIFDFSPVISFGRLDKRGVRGFADLLQREFKVDMVVVEESAEKLLVKNVTEERVEALRDLVSGYKNVVFSGTVSAAKILVQKIYKKPVFSVDIPAKEARTLLRIKMNPKVTVPRDSNNVVIPGKFDDLDALRDRISTLIDGCATLESFSEENKPLVKTTTAGIFSLRTIAGTRYTFTEGPKYWQANLWENFYAVLGYDIHFCRYGKRFDELGFEAEEFTGGLPELKEILHSISPEAPIALDIEATGTEPWRMVDLTNPASTSPVGAYPKTKDAIPQKIISVSFAIDGKKGYSFFVEHPSFPQYNGVELLTYLCGLPNPKIAHNGKFEFQWIELYYKIPLNGLIVDTMLTEHVIDENLSKATKRYTLAGLTARRLCAVPHKGDFLDGLDTGLPKKKLTDKANIPDAIVRQIARQAQGDVVQYRNKDFTKLSRADLHTYGGYDSVVTYRIFFQQLRELKRRGMDTAKKWLVKDIHNRMIRGLGQMEFTGMPVNTDTVLETISKCDDIANAELAVLEDKYGVDRCNYASSKDVTFLIKEEHEDLFARLPKNKKGECKLDAETLAVYNEPYPFLKNLAEYKHARKARGTYMLPFLQYATNSRVHFSFVIPGTATGRIASRNPNVQNIPSSIGTIRVKTALEPEVGMQMFNMDLATAELKFLAMYSKDEAMLGVIRAGGDLHAYTAAKAFNLEYEDILRSKSVRKKDRTEQDKINLSARQSAKSINFGIVYGISASKLANELNISEDEAQGYIDSYFESYPGVARFLMECRNRVKSHGYLETIFGRRRNVTLGPARDTPNWVVNRMERQAMNFMIQSTTSDWLQYLMKELVDIKGVISHITVHDSLVFSFDKTKNSFRNVIAEFKRILVDRPKELWPEFMVADVGHDFSVGNNYGESNELTDGQLEEMVRLSDFS